MLGDTGSDTYARIHIYIHGVCTGLRHIYTYTQPMYDLGDMDSDTDKISSATTEEVSVPSSPSSIFDHTSTSSDCADLLSFLAPSSSFNRRDGEHTHTASSNHTCTAASSRTVNSRHVSSNNGASSRGKSNTGARFVSLAAKVAIRTIDFSLNVDVRKSNTSNGNVTADQQTNTQKPNNNSKVCSGQNHIQISTDSSKTSTHTKNDSDTYTTTNDLKNNERCTDAKKTGPEKKKVKKTGDSVLRYKLSSGGAYNCVRSALKRSGFKPTKSNKFNLLWGKPLKFPEYKVMNAYVCV